MKVKTHVSSLFLFPQVLEGILQLNCFSSLKLKSFLFSLLISSSHVIFVSHSSSFLFFSHSFLLFRVKLFLCNSYLRRVKVRQVSCDFIIFFLSFVMKAAKKQYQVRQVIIIKSLSLSLIIFAFVLFVLTEDCSDAIINAFLWVMILDRK